MPFDDTVERTPEAIAEQLKALVKHRGGSAKGCAVVVSSPDALVRIIEQPETPPEILRDALRLNGTALMNQDCRNFVLDCVDCETPAAAPQTLAANAPVLQRRYLVA